MNARSTIRKGAILCVATAFVACPRFQQRPRRPVKRDALVRVGAEQIFVDDRGAGRPVLLIHGYGSTHRSFSRIARQLRADHRLLAIDLPGFGLSDKYAGDYSPAAIADKLRRLLDQKKIARVDVVAHSWGASIALALALRAGDRVRSLTLIGAWVFEEQLPPFILWSRVPGVGELLFSLFFGQRIDDRMALAFYDPEPYVQPAVIDRIKRDLARPGAIAAALAAARGQRFSAMQRRYRTLSQPTLLLWGRDDRISLLEFGYRLERLMPNARLEVIERCGHLPQVERPQRVLHHLLPFLEGGRSGHARRPTTSSPTSRPQTQR